MTDAPSPLAFSPSEVDDPRTNPPAAPESPEPSGPSAPSAPMVPSQPIYVPTPPPTLQPQVGKYEFWGTRVQDRPAPFGCAECGAAVWNRQLHDAWHSNVIDRLRRLEVIESYFPIPLHVHLEPAHAPPPTSPQIPVPPTLELMLQIIYLSSLNSPPTPPAGPSQVPVSPTLTWQQFVVLTTAHAPPPPPPPAPVPPTLIRGFVVALTNVQVPKLTDEKDIVPKLPAVTRGPAPKGAETPTQFPAEPEPPPPPPPPEP